ncbi:MAG: ribonuclease H-like domain-containing protein, partial [Theionarchaea archaeon]|nr:ribonuclease H-like domain-containing protein [Theionarchaea archaeon]
TMIYGCDYIGRDHAIIRLFSKNTEKHIEYDEDFLPYIYGIGTICQELSKVQGIRECIPVTKTFKGKEVDAVKIIFHFPKDVPVFREELGTYCDIFEHDIPFARRYLIDSNIYPMSGEGELTVVSVDIETYTETHPNAEKEPIIMISLATPEKSVVLTYKENNKDFTEVLHNEKEMLDRFFELVQELNPEVIVTYNGDNFDFPYILQRAKILKIHVPLEFRILGRGATMKVRVPGFAHIDLFPISKRLLNLRSYTLESVYQDLTGEEKSKIPGDKISVYWDREGESLDMLLDYSREDAETTLVIAEKFLPLQYALSRIVGQTPFDISRASTSAMVDWLLLREAHNRGEIAPNPPGGKEYQRRASQSYEGAYVLEPEKGIHENLVQLDFRSLYPSIIITHNIDPLTLGCDCCDNTSPAGYTFCVNRKGFIPEILKTLLKERAKVKEKMKSDNDKMLYVQQWALKILANSFYGYMGYPRARWYSLECAESTTAWGRMYLKRIIDMAKKEDLKVIYGDTDSVFIKMKDTNVDKTLTFLETVNTSLPETMELEFEGFYPRGLFVTKKKYALIDDNENFITKGLEIVRRDWANIAKKTQRNVLEIILKEGDPEKAAEVITEVTQKIKTREVDVTDLIIYTRLTMPLSQYKQVGPHVQIAKRMKRRGEEVGAGSTIAYIVTEGSGLIRDRSVLYSEFLKRGLAYDADYYIENQVLPAVMRVMKAFGYSEEELVYQKTQQTSLEKWF